MLVQAEQGLDFAWVNRDAPPPASSCDDCSGCDTVGAPHLLVGVADQEQVEISSASDSGAAGEELILEVVRRAAREDIVKHEQRRLSEDDARRHIIARAAHFALDMRISDAEWQWDGSRLTVYFTADKRVDFRALARDLAGHFRTRIELRQIGARDEAARIGGIGRCGREYCCTTWLNQPAPVNLTLAKDQSLSLNPTQISGGCGRLLCCLRYEHDFYLEARKRFPKEGKVLQTLVGSEKVIAIDIFRELIQLRGRETPTRSVSLLQLRDELARVEASAGPEQQHRNQSGIQA